MGFFANMLRPTYGYKVVIEVKVNDMTTKVVKQVRAKSKKQAEKEALYLCTKDVKLQVHTNNRIKRSRA
jgi:hypothetical protein